MSEIKRISEDLCLKWLSTGHRSDYKTALYDSGVQLGNMLIDSKLIKGSDCRLICTVEDVEWFAKGIYDVISQNNYQVNVGVYWVHRYQVSSGMKISHVVHRFREWGETRTEQLILCSAFQVEPEVARSLILENFDDIGMSGVITLASIVESKQVINYLKSEFTSDVCIESCQLANSYPFEDHCEQWENARGLVCSSLGLTSESDRLIFMPEFISSRISVD